jgi:hypothetical protein
MNSAISAASRITASINSKRCARENALPNQAFRLEAVSEAFKLKIYAAFILKCRLRSEAIDERKP